MINLVLTYNIDNAANRADFVQAYEAVLHGMNLNKEAGNQSTYYGQCRNIPDFLTNLFNAVAKFQWQNGDVVTIYYPKVLKAQPVNLPDIGRHEFKSAGAKLLNHVIFGV